MTPEDIPARDQVFLNPWLGDYLSGNSIKHSDLARAMHIDASIISLWAVGERPVPHNRLEALAAALDLSLDEVLSHALTVTGGYFQRAFRRTQPLAEVTPVVRAEVVPALKPKVPPSEYRLLWCRHGPGSRLHHHGYEQVYGPVGAIAEFR